MRISDWSSDVCSSDLYGADIGALPFHQYWLRMRAADPAGAGALTDYSLPSKAALAGKFCRPSPDPKNPLSNIPHAYRFDARSEEQPSELQSLMRISYAVFCLKNQTQ